MSAERERMLMRIADALRGRAEALPHLSLEATWGEVGQASSPADKRATGCAGGTLTPAGELPAPSETPAPLGATLAPSGELSAPLAGAAEPASSDSVVAQGFSPVGAALMTRFSEELVALTGRAYVVAGLDEAVGVIREIVARTGGGPILCWDAADLGEDDVAPRLESGGTKILSYELPADADERRRVLAELDPVQVGLTGAVAGLADTGSIVLTSGPGRGRLVSLLPPVHIALLSRRRLYPSLPSFLAAHPDTISHGSNLVIITGPSRTADIEMTLTHGVHGPREVHVILTP